jgi:hypothetical protein
MLILTQQVKKYPGLYTTQKLFIDNMVAYHLPVLSYKIAAYTDTIFVQIGGPV